MEKVLAWMWSIILALAIARVIMGGAPNWVDVFSPLAVVVFNCWIDVYLKGSK